MSWLLRILLLVGLGYLALLTVYSFFQRKLLYYPTHHDLTRGLTEWRHQGRVIGFAREARSPKNVWLMMHGNGGQAGDRVYAIPSFSEQDSVFILEYPGYGKRPGSPSMASIDAAAKEGYEALRSRFPAVPLCVVGESIGSGPASMLARQPQPPAKIVLITPFDLLHRVAAYHFPYLPARFFLRDNWNNIEALKGYRGPVEIFGARADDIIPIRFARSLAQSKPGCTFHEIQGGHNDWASDGRVTIRNP